MKINIWVADVRLVRDSKGQLDDKPRFKYAVLATDGVHATTVLRDHLMSTWDVNGVVFEVTRLRCQPDIMQIDDSGQIEPAGDLHAIAALVLTNAARGVKR